MVSRRRLLEASAGIGAMTTLGMAGCLDSDGSTSISMGGGASGSVTNGNGQALSRALSEESETVNMTIQETEGWESNVYLYDDGEFPACSIDNNTVTKARNDEDGFADQPVDELPYQGFNHTTLEYFWVAVEGSGIETTDDLIGRDVYPVQPGTGSGLLAREILEEAGMIDDINLINVDTGDAAGAIQEGTIEALVGYGSVRDSLAGWVAEVDTRNDVYLMEMSDTFEDAIDRVGGARKETIEPYGWTQDVTSTLGIEEITCWILDGQWYFGPDVSEDTAYEIARVSHEHSDVVRDADSAYVDHSDAEAMTASAIDDIPFHPGIAEFFEDVGVWDDSWEVGEI